MKICKECKIPQELEEFSKHKGFKDGLNSRCKECIKNYHKEYFSQENNKNKKQQYQIDYNVLNKDKNYQYQKERKKRLYKSNPLFKLEISLRSRIYKAIIKGKGIKNEKTLNLIGCEPNEVKLYLENQFLPPFTWENHGEIWEIDHIKSCASFNLLDENQRKE